MGTPSSENLMLGAGSLYFARKDMTTGKIGGERHLGNATDFTVTTETEKKEKFSSMTGSKRLLKSVVTQIKSTGKLKLDEYDPENLALALLGEAGVITQTALTAQTVTVNAELDRWFPVGKYKIKTVEVVNHTTPATVYVEGTDYEVDAKIGRIHILPTTTAITDGELVDITFDCDAATLPKVVGGTQAVIEGFLRFVGDPTAGPAYNGEFWNVSVTPDGDMGFIGDDWGSFGLSIECQDDSQNHPGEPFHRLVKIN